jgi:hypothetical protein
MIYRCQPFDLNDRALIERAFKTGRPDHMAKAIKAAMEGFRQRLKRLPTPPVINGELVIRIIEPSNYFDKFVIDHVIQEACNATGMGVALHKAPAIPGCRQPASPEVEFTSSSDREKTATK